MRYVLRAFVHLGLFLPLATAGTLLNWIPYRLVGRLARRAEAPDVVSTYKLLAALLVFPAAWLGTAGVALWLVNPLLAIVVALGAPASGYVAILFHERSLELRERTRAYLLLRRRRDLAASLSESRRRIVLAVQELDELARQSPSVATGPAPSARQ